MTWRRAFVLFAIISIVAGFWAQAELHERVDVPAVMAIEDEQSSVASMPAPGESFSIDASGLTPTLASMEADERPEQIADWVVMGTLAYAGVPANAVRAALFDRPPVRTQYLESVLNFDYGDGRRVVMPDGSVWLFRSSRDRAPRKTIGRLADQVRVETGRIPERVMVFSYRTTLTDGTIDIVREPDVGGADLFSPKYGYHEAVVRTADELAAWLANVDDVVHARIQGDGVELGGRRFAEARTEGVNLEHVASIYRSHRIAAGRRETIENLKRVNSLAKAFIDRVDEEAYGRAADAAIDAVGRTRTLLASVGADVPAFDLATARYQVLGADRNERLKAIKALVEYRDALSNSISPAFIGSMRDPGFSLDWYWDLPELRRTLALMLDDPAALVAQASTEAKTAHRYPSDATRYSVIVAAKLAEVGGIPDLPAGVREQLKTVRQQIDRITDAKQQMKQVEVAVVPLLQLAHSGETPLAMMATYVQARSQCQCARYNGTTAGTAVGMNLFYTDMLAKIWAANDYYSSAPQDEIVGLRTVAHVKTMPFIDGNLFATRLWFGTRDEAIDVVSDDEMNFSHIASRVFAKGSDPTKPKDKESVPEESSRITLQWWDRHYVTIADYEPQYHVQNQIMKWSVITGWLAGRGMLTSLDSESLAGARNLRFDRWYASNPSLRFRNDVRFLPTSKWTYDTECMELLSSYGITGGVTLGGRETVQKAVRIPTGVPSSLRRAAARYDALENGVITTVKETKFELPAIEGSTARAVMTPSKTARLRTRFDELRVSSLETRFRTSGGRSSFELWTGDRPYGQLTLQRRQRSIRMEWSRNEVSESSSAAEYVAHLNAGEPPRVPPPPNTRLLVDDGGKYEAFVLPFARRVKERKVFAVVAGPSKRGDAITSTVRFRSGAPVYVETIPIAEAAMRQKLAEYAWQRIEPVSGGGLTAIFQKRGPPDGARAFRVRSSAGEIEGFAQDGTVYLKRPASGDTRAFDDFIISEQISYKFVTELLTPSDTPRVTPAAKTPAAHIAAELTATGDLNAALKRLEAESKSGSFDQILSDVRKHVQQSAASIREGVTGSVVIGGAQPATADGLIAKGVEAARSGKIGDASGHFTAALRRGPPDRTAETIAALAEDGRTAAVAELLRGGASSEMLSRVDVRASGNVLHTVLPLDAAGTTSRVHSPSATAQNLRRSGEVFFVDKKLLGKYDWDGSPGPSLHRAARDPKVDWVEFDAVELGEFRPTTLRDPDTMYSRFAAAPEFDTRSDPQGHWAELLRGQHVVVLRARPCPIDAATGDCEE